MFNSCNRDLNHELAALSARLNEIASVPYETSFPKMTEAEEAIAKGVARIASKARNARRPVLEKTEKFDDWEKHFSLDHICIWAMSGKYDVFVDLLEPFKNDRHSETPFSRPCLHGVSFLDVEKRKALLRKAIETYAAEVQSQKSKRERGQ